eukprot:CAMPEP_0180783914 /NCGR_PEP_ID=MMETSP1038_2-20121128/49295_1 /TAXON_ID=632150 /ORGANISM="Azadinium spinosum, Strain 3D9" /LENGTH=178 /DNA_ID=CAMNT_0022820549 /DNA_START=80 /DNA_END=615 /DNA_ORIENTATION=+
MTPLAADPQGLAPHSTAQDSQRAALPLSCELLQKRVSDCTRSLRQVLEEGPPVQVIALVADHHGRQRVSKAALLQHAAWSLPSQRHLRRAQRGQEEPWEGEATLVAEVLATPGHYLRIDEGLSALDVPPAETTSGNSITNSRNGTPTWFAAIPRPPTLRIVSAILPARRVISSEAASL